MLDRHPRRNGDVKRRRAGRKRASPLSAERLEDRQLLAFTPLGFSIPDLAILNSFNGPVAALGGEVTVTVDVSNLGQSSLPEPLAQFPGARSTADAPPSEIEVFLTNRPHGLFSPRVSLGTIELPSIPQNRLLQIQETFTLPTQLPPGFPTTGDNAFITLVLDPDREIRDLDRTNNFTRNASPVLLVPRLPELAATGLALPPTLNPGDTVIPEVKIANFGAAPTNEQAPLLVQVVASLDTDFGPGDVVLSSFQIPNVNPLSEAPTELPVFGDVRLTEPPNVVTRTATDPVALPDFDQPFFVGVAVDPFDQILEIDEIDRPPSSRLEQIRSVASSGLDLPPAGVAPVEPTNLPFPFPPVEPLPQDDNNGPIQFNRRLGFQNGEALRRLFRNRPIEHIFQRRFLRRPF